MDHSSKLIMIIMKEINIKMKMMVGELLKMVMMDGKKMMRRVRWILFRGPIILMGLNLK